MGFRTQSVSASSSAPVTAPTPSSATNRKPSRYAHIRTTIKAYYHLTKPGIIYGNLISALGGFLFASQGVVDWLLGAGVVSGTALVIASGCVLNNYIDRNIDAKMARTQQRALVQGLIPALHALIFAGVLSLLGFGILATFTNLVTVYVGMAGLYCYVVAYGIAKRRGAIGTIVGSFSGSTPIAAGYTAAAGQFDGGALLVFLAMAFWQMPHFYAIAMFRLKDYKNAGVPVLPAVRGNAYTKSSIMVYIVLFAATTSLLTISGYASYFFLAAMLAFSTWWFAKGFRGLRGPSDADTAWARKMFGGSLVVLLALSLLLGIDPFIS